MQVEAQISISGSDQMTESQDPLGIHPAVGDDAKKAGVKIEATPMVP
jgi:hypothetical protein